ncbi:(2Fe-2S)-binding protein [Planomonospora alba]|uniref:(2Fe-2S)-binding protein n=1 Tax=Planomonospora alba TaxID=161354 RepID=A0ABP6NG76_9ACTN
MHRPRPADGAEPSAPPVSGASVVQAAADLSAIGGYFSLQVGGPAGDGWRPLAGLLTAPAALEEMITGVAARLGTGQMRVAASVCFQGLAARLWSPALAAAAVHDLLIDLDPERVYWRAASGGPLPLCVPRPAGRRLGGHAPAGGPLYDAVVAALLEPLIGTVRQVVRIAPGLLRGNAASALAGAADVLARRRPAAAAATAALARDLLDRGLLRGTGEVTGPASGRLAFVRRSCCLYYRLPGGGMCGDCALSGSAARRARRARAVNGPRAER